MLHCDTILLTHKNNISNISLLNAQLTEGGPGGKTGGLVLYRVVMVLSCPVDRAPILLPRLVEMTAKETAHGPDLAKRRNALVNKLNKALFTRCMIRSKIPCCV